MALNKSKLIMHLNFFFKYHNRVVLLSTLEKNVQKLI